jgi:hypothetical protein
MQDGNGIMIKILPAAGREVQKDFLGALVPGPPDIVGQTVEVSDQLGQFFRR